MKCSSPTTSDMSNESRTEAMQKSQMHENGARQKAKHSQIIQTMME